MLSVDLTSSNTVAYQKLIRHILKNSDCVSFHFPGLYPDGELLPDKEIKKYFENSHDFLQQCLQRSIKSTISRDYNGMKLGVYSKIIYVKPFPTLNNMLLHTHLFDWLMQNNLPEDVCFYYQNKLRFFSCSHDEDFYIYEESDKDLNFLQSNDFIFYK